MKRYIKTTVVPKVAQVVKVNDNEIKKVKEGDPSTIRKLMKAIKSFNDEPSVINSLSVSYSRGHFDISFADGREIILYNDDLKGNWVNRVWETATTRMPSIKRSTSSFDMKA